MNEPTRKVEAGYDAIAERYLATKSLDVATQAVLEELAQCLPGDASVLDLGCGAGVPVTSWLAARFDVTGVDVSSQQLALARERVPAVRLIKADMVEINFAPQSFDAVTAFFAIIHVPREKQAALVGRIRGWLKPGGRFLAPWAVAEWEGEDADWERWGSPMWWSHFGADANRKMLEEAGFQILSARQRTDNAETWLWIMARRPLA